MLSSKPVASLSPTLLARKGQARPAMRRQGLNGFSSLAHAGDDLGWNDMGEGAPELPPVLVERRRLVEDYVPEDSAELPLEPEPVAEVAYVEVAAPTPTKAQPAPDQGERRCAFTLRLDAERHLKLRLATATRGRSAQKLVTEALDAFLATLPDVSALHAQLAGADQPIVRGK